MNEDIQARVQEIKRSFRLVMDGATASSMREKGLNYKLNWGASMVMLRQMAEEIGQDYDLAIALWKENIRECKMLATMLMPADKMLPEVADLWMEQTTTIEVAEQAAFNLYQHLPFAADMAFRYIATDAPLYQLTGFHILSRLFMNKQEPNERGINEVIDQAMAALHGDNLTVKKAAMQCLYRLGELGLVYQRIVDSALRSAQFSNPV